MSRALGVPGIPEDTELAIVQRDIDLVRETGVHVHFQHVSTAISFDAIRRAKAEGLPITCETAPHYLALNDEALLKYGTLAKMNPPLRSEKDRQATIAAIADGTVDMIATDHAPHTLDEKRLGFLEAPNGIIGLECAFGVCHKILVDGGYISDERLTDHAPHTLDEKRLGFLEAPNGIIGLECAFGVCHKILVDGGYISDERLIELMALNPASLMGRHSTDIAGLLNTSARCADPRGRRLYQRRTAHRTHGAQPGVPHGPAFDRHRRPAQHERTMRHHTHELMALNPASLMGRHSTDIAGLLNTSARCATTRTLDLAATEHPESNDLVILGLDDEWTVAADEFKSNARNTPFDGWQVTGRPRRGRIQIQRAQHAIRRLAGHRPALRDDHRIQARVPPFGRAALTHPHQPDGCARHPVT